MLTNLEKRYYSNEYCNETLFSDEVFSCPNATCTGVCNNTCSLVSAGVYLLSECYLPSPPSPSFSSYLEEFSDSACTLFKFSLSYNPSVCIPISASTTPFSQAVSRSVQDGQILSARAAGASSFRFVCDVLGTYFEFYTSTNCTGTAYGSTNYRLEIPLGNTCQSM